MRAKEGAHLQQEDLGPGRWDHSCECAAVVTRAASGAQVRIAMGNCVRRVAAHSEGGHPPTDGFVAEEG